MQIYNNQQVTGHQIDVKVTDQRHINGKQVSPKSDDPVKPFAEVLFNAVEHVNKLNLDADKLETAMVVAPEEVNIHEVMIASEKARLSLNLMKTLIDKAIKAYNEIMMIR